MKYILASASPRRRELFRFVRPNFEILVPDADEVLPANISDADAAQFLAELKGNAAAAQFKIEDAVFIAADTIVCSAGRILGKPKDEADAYDMLAALSGKTHTVYTGVAIISGNRKSVFSEATDVDFYSLSDAEIHEYIATGEPFDKAGAYGIQGRGALLIKGISGDYFNVVGLPVSRLFRELEAFENVLRQCAD